MTAEGASEAGRRLWSSVVDRYELEEHELAILREAVRTLDTIEAYADVIATEGVTAMSSQGQRAHPAVVESRQQRTILARLLTTLGLPEEDEGAAARSGAARGAYGIRRVS